MKTYIVDAVRTHVGKYGGALAQARPDDLAAATLKAIVERSSIQASNIDEVILGAANQSGEDNRNIARMAVLLAGFPVEVPGFTVNRLCASGLQAVASASDAISSGRADLIIAGGSESMTRAPWVTAKPSKEWAKPGPMFDTALGWRFVNPLMAEHDGGLTTLALGEATEKLAKEFAITRKESDEFALRSHQRSTLAWQSGFYGPEIVKTEHASKLTMDETIRADSTYQSLEKLKPSFTENGVITAGSASPLSDGASALLVVSEKALTKFNLKPIAQIVGFDVAGVRPYQFGIGPVPAINRVLTRLGMKISDIDAIEINEAFAAQTLACIKELKIDVEIVNNRGGAIALGHPLGSSGSRILGTLISRLHADDQEFGIASLCIGVGQGAAMVVKRI
ncbi:MAG: thiolase family protein [Candidatus Nanopelagicaceae bacterium]